MFTDESKTPAQRKEDEKKLRAARLLVKRQTELERLTRLEKRWVTKLRRANTTLRKIRRSRKALLKRMAANQSDGN